MIVCDDCGLQFIEWGRDEMCPRCKHRVNELDDIAAITAERDRYKAERDYLLEKMIEIRQGSIWAKDTTAEDAINRIQGGK